MWEQATLVSTDSLEQRADAAVCEQLLPPLIDDRSMRLVLRDAVLRSWELTSVAADGNHATVVVSLVLAAVRYLADVEQTRQAGSAD